MEENAETSFEKNVANILAEVRNIDVNQMMKDMNGGHSVHQSFWWTYQVPAQDDLPLELISYMIYLAVTCLVTCVFSIVADLQK